MDFDSILQPIKKHLASVEKLLTKQITSQIELSEDIIITRGELEYLNKVKKAYSLFMYLYQGYLDNKSIINK